MMKNINIYLTVDNINNLVVDGTYKPNLGKQHTHVGSIHNLSLDKIAEKYPKN